MSKFKNLVAIPDVTIYKGIIVDENTNLKYTRKDGNLKTEVKNLKYVRYEKVETGQYTRVEKITVPLKKGMVVIFENAQRGLVVPQNKFVTIDYAIDDYECIKDLGEKEYKIQDVMKEEEQT